MTDQLACSDCGQALELGFIPDATYGAVAQSHWHAGEPEEARVFGIKAGVKADWSQTIPITAYRCTGCGLLKFHAVRESD